ncbi:MAG: outer membrane beta-barrel protein [Kiritimatiellia bacterium]|nr:outer membrane beta-barrel protein [Kiritimatiellia bacterium]MDD4173839.1 outer membrane beta-barrel protein [Kiritimatiellia bacterium]MDD4441913.1 outer membrane beta-barrel protein [Kiritimatiellia bacterium]NLC82373.1 outer membrane beta-barrel protein [Lentisphaerota bacterium]
MATRCDATAWMGIGVLFVVLLGITGFAQETRGLKFNNLTVSPYVNVEYNYDSNVDLDKREYDDSYLTVNPGVDLTYTGNDWGLKGNAWYGYDKYLEYSELDEPRYGQSLSVYKESAKGWRLVLGESYMKSRENDSIIDGGRGIWRERDIFELTGALSYQMSERTGVTLSGQYSDLNYNNDGDMYGQLFGWQEWSAGLELSRKLSEKSNLLVSGTYQEYESDGAKGLSTQSTGYSLMAGFGSRATERISYRVLTGASWFDYADGDQLTGWTYSLDASWLINKKWAATLAGSSYFQPSEREMNQAMQVYTMSGGLTYRPMRKLTTRMDLAYRREENEYARIGVGSVTDEVYSLRLRADYQLMRHVSVYGGIEYEDWMSDDDNQEYDRFLGTLGLNFRY